MKKLLTTEAMQLLTTPRLLAYKTSLMQVPETPSWEEDNVDRLNKTSPAWIETYNALKEILKTRGNIQ